MWSPVLYFLLLATVRAATATDYCRKDLCLPGITHIACRNYGDFDESCGSEVVIQKMPVQLRAQLLYFLNGFRNTVALGKYTAFRPAARMATLRWHDELAGLAKFALRRCEKLVNGYCSNTDEFQYVSYIYGSTKWEHKEESPRSLVEVLKFWLNDIKACNMSQINAESPPKKGECRGFFTQIVQDLAAHVGCAMMRNHTNGVYQYGLLCQFSRGKVAHQLVYRESLHPASSCIAGINPAYHGLCSPDEHVNPNALQFGSLT